MRSGGPRAYRREREVSLETTAIPEYVLRALHDVEEQLPPDCYELETVLTFVHLFGFDDACSWLQDHHELYFSALRRCFEQEQPAPLAPR
jgi:hypothetical protein